MFDVCLFVCLSVFKCVKIPSKFIRNCQPQFFLFICFFVTRILLQVCLCVCMYKVTVLQITTSRNFHFSLCFEGKCFQMRSAIDKKRGKRWCAWVAEKRKERKIHKNVTNKKCVLVCESFPPFVLFRFFGVQCGWHGNDAFHWDERISSLFVLFKAAFCGVLKFFLDCVSPFKSSFFLHDLWLPWFNETFYRSFASKKQLINLCSCFAHSPKRGFLLEVRYTKQSPRNIT